MSLGWFSPFEPAQTTIWPRKPSLEDSFSWVRGGSTPSNWFKPLFGLGNQSYRIVSHQFGVIQLLWKWLEPLICWAYSTVSHEFGVVRIHRTFLNHGHEGGSRPVGHTWHCLLVDIVGSVWQRKGNYLLTSLEWTIDPRFRPHTDI